MWNYIEQNRQYWPLALVLLAASVLLLLGIFVIRTPAYYVVVNGEKLCAIKNTAIAQNYIKEIEIQEEKSTKKKLELCSKIDFKRGIAARKDIVTNKDLKNRLEKSLSFKATAAVITVNGKEIVFLDNKKIAEKLLKELKDESSCLEDGEKLIKLSFEEKVDIKEKKVEAKKIVDPAKAYALITTGTSSPEKYTVQDGDSLWLIARRNDMYVDDIVKANHLNSEDLQLGQELILEKSKPYINIVAEVEGEKVEAIPFETKTVIDRNASASVKIKQTGQNGEKRITYVATKRNGVIEKRKIKEETIIKEAVTQILIKGNRVTQVASRGGGGTGNLDWPVYGQITNYFRGSSHTGVDIANRRGTSLKAADSGYVSFTGWQGGYGKFIIIDHGNGIVTRYAHCDSISVSVGQRVSKGQVIGTLGSTGNSTGPHLHFETLVNGSFCNPLNYLR